MGLSAFGSHPLVEFHLLMLRRREPSITGDQASVAMRLSTRLSGAEFALLSRPRAASGATDRLYLFEGRLLGLHCLLMMYESEAEKRSILHNALG